MPSWPHSEAVSSNYTEGEREKKVCLHLASKSEKVLIEMERMTEESLPATIFFHYLVLFTLNKVLSNNSRNSIPENGRRRGRSHRLKYSCSAFLIFLSAQLQELSGKEETFFGDLLSLLAVSNHLCQDI